MNNATLKQLLNEYEIKRSQAILIAEKKKEDFKNDAAASALHRACDPDRLRRDQRQRGRRRHPVGSG